MAACLSASFPLTHTDGQPSPAAGAVKTLQGAVTGSKNRQTLTPSAGTLAPSPSSIAPEAALSRDGAQQSLRRPRAPPSPLLVFTPTNAPAATAYAHAKPPR